MPSWAVAPASPRFLNRRGPRAVPAPSPHSPHATPRASTPARAGDLCGLTGIDAPYEAPSQPDLVLRSGSESIEAAVARVMDVLGARLLHGSVGE